MAQLEIQLKEHVSERKSCLDKAYLTPRESYVELIFKGAYWTFIEVTYLTIVLTHIGFIFCLPIASNGLMNRPS